MTRFTDKRTLSIEAKLSEEKENGKTSVCSSGQQYDLNDLIGQFGIYQISVMAFYIIREALTSFDNVVLSLALPLDDTYRCAISDTHNQSYLDMQQETGYDPRCYHINAANTTVVPCTEWTFQDKYKNTMLAQWNLVCDRRYLTPIIHSSFFVGATLGSLVWGPLADKFGRWKSYSICHTVYLIFGAASVFAPDAYWFMVFRFLAGFHAIGYYILPTLQVEIIGTKYRSFCILNHLGWGIGMFLAPLVGHFAHQWRYLIAVIPVTNALMMPWMFILPESIRWLILNNEMDKARKEIKRASKFNRLSHVDFDQKIDKFLVKKKLDQMDCSESRGSVTKLFTNSALLKAMIILSSVYFMLMYIFYARTLHFAPDEASMFANFLITGTGEWISLFISTISVLYISRKGCLAISLTITSASLIVEAIAHSTMDSVWPILDYTTEASIKVFVMCATLITILVNLETLPTELRQSGTTVVCIMGCIGTAIAPFYIRLNEILGHISHTLLLALITILLAISIQYFLRETGKSEIIDAVATKAHPDNKPTKLSSVISNKDDHNETVQD